MIKQITTGTNNSKHNTGTVANNNLNENITKSNAIAKDAKSVPIKTNETKSKRCATPSLNNSKITFPDDKGIKDKPQIVISNDKTNDSTTVQVKLGHNSSASNIFANKLNKSFIVVPYTKINYTRAKDRLIKDYLLGINMEHCSDRSKLQIEKEELYKNYENNINLLENWIKSIKTLEVNITEKEYLHKKESIIDLIEKIKSIRGQISNSKKGVNTNRINNYKYTDQINKGKERVEKKKTEHSNMLQCIDILKKEMPNYRSQINIAKEENKMTNEAITLQQNDINKLNINIQQMSKKISDVNKEKETALASITSLKKQIEACRHKINNSFTKSTSFMLHLNDLVEKLELF